MQLSGNKKSQKKDIKTAKICLEIALEEYHKDGDRDILLQSLRDIIQAQGGFSELSRKTGMNRAGLYRAFGKNGNPTFETMENVVKYLGFKISIQPA